MIKGKLNRKKLYSKLWDYKKANQENTLSNEEYVLGYLKIIEEEFNYNKPIKNDKFVFGKRQKIMIEEYEDNMKKQKYFEAYTNIEDFIGYQFIPVDRINGLKEEKYICEKEVNQIVIMVNRLKKQFGESLDKEREDKNKMGIFKWIKKKNKYEVNPEENVPELVYGIH